MSKRTTVTPPFTRVHKLFRIRTVVGAVCELVGRDEEATDSQIADVLAKRKLSKMSFERIRHRIRRRARDHLLNAAYMGLITRSKHRPYNYHPTPIGTMLGNYSFTDECPKDVHEKAIFIDRLMRLKLTNVYDLQLKRTYETFLTRPLLYLITLLRFQPLHLYEIYYALGEEESDPFFHKETTYKVLNGFSQYKPYDETMIGQFSDDYDMNRRTKREARRSAKPVLDWCEQLGLIFSENDWYFITELGISVQQRYSQYVPIWYHLLGENHRFKASLIVAYLIAGMKEKAISKRLLRKKITGKLVEETILDVLRDLQSRFQVFNSRFSALAKPVDFDFYYDVPVEEREETIRILKTICKHFGLGDPDLASLETNEVRLLEEEIKETIQEKTITQIGQILNIDIPRPELFKVPFEWTSCFLLRCIGYRANKYQGHFSESS